MAEAEKPKRGRGRPAGYQMPQRVRDRIRTSVLITQMEKIALGKIIADPHQVTAGLGLLKKTLPDLQAVDLTSGGEPFVIERTVFRAKKGSKE